MRSLNIISLIPSATEIISALGYQDNLVGRSHECDFPLDIQRIPICTQTLVDSNLSSKKIDEEVKYRLVNGLSIYRLDLDLIAQLQPDLIVTQSQCSVCAIDVDEVRKNLISLAQLKKEIEVVALEAINLESVFDDIQKIADSLEKSSRGDSLINRMKNELHQLHACCPSCVPQPKIACIEWIDPLMAAGNWIPSLVELAGGKNLFSTNGKPSPYVKVEDFVSEDPDIIIIMACGFTIKRTAHEMKSFLLNETLKKLQAIKHQKVFLVDANQFFVRPGPRLVDSLQILCEIIHPNEFPPAYKGIGWQNLGDVVGQA